MNQFILTRAQLTVLRSLAVVVPGELAILQNRYHSSAMALVRHGLVEKVDRTPYRPGYRLTPQGRLIANKVTP